MKRYLDKLPLPPQMEDNLMESARVIEMIGAWKQLTVQERFDRLKNTRDGFYSPYLITSYPHHSYEAGYEITVVDCITEYPPLIQGDHAFADDTYQAALLDNLNNLREEKVIYHAY